MTQTKSRPLADGSSLDWAREDRDEPKTKPDGRKFVPIIKSPTSGHEVRGGGKRVQI